MSLTNSAPPLRGQCIKHTASVFCLCSRFSPAHDPHYCHTCGHGIHAHADYMSRSVHHCPATYCAAYVQDTPRTQECTCSVQLIDHLPIDNLYRSPAAKAEFFAGGVRSDVDTPASNAVTLSSPDIANVTLSRPSLVPSPSHQFVNPYRTPAAVPYRAGQSNTATSPSSTVPANSPNIANFTPPRQSLVPSPHQFVNLHRTPATVPYGAGFFAGGVQSNAATPFSNAFPTNSPNITNFTLPCQPLVPSPSHQLYSSEPTTQTGRYPHTNDGYDADTTNGQLYYHSNVTNYSTAPDTNSGPYA